MMVGDKMRLSNYSPYLNSKARINLRQASIINSLGIIYRGRRVKNKFWFDPLRCPAVSAGSRSEYQYHRNKIYSLLTMYNMDMDAA
jgi:hypothetical protein